MIEIDIHKQLNGSDGLMDLDISMSIESGSFIAITGKSGSGKSTLLRILAGLTKASGKIVVDNEVWMDTNYTKDIQSRQIGFVFQDYALFENMTIEQNLLFVNKDKELANRLLSMCELDSMSDRLPSHLSGGQKQRVAIARALLHKPSIVILDESTSALDIDTEEKVFKNIESFLESRTSIIIAHRAETIAKADEIYMIKNRSLIKV